MYDCSRHGTQRRTLSLLAFDDVCPRPCAVHFIYTMPQQIKNSQHSWTINTLGIISFQSSSVWSQIVHWHLASWEVVTVYKKKLAGTHWANWLTSDGTQDTRQQQLILILCFAGDATKQILLHQPCLHKLFSVNQWFLFSLVIQDRLATNSLKFLKYNNTSWFSHKSFNQN